MTTKVTVDAHAGWDVEVITVQGEINYQQVNVREIVTAYTQKDFYIHSGMYLQSVREVGPNKPK